MGYLPLKGFGIVIILAIIGGSLYLPHSYGAANGDTRSRQAPGESATREAEAEPILPLRGRRDLDERKVKLGEILFSDPRLSKDDSIACVSCHSLTTGGTDRMVTSRGIGGTTVARNAPTIFNSGFNFRQFWDGRAATLEDQIDGPMLSPEEMGSQWPEILAKLQRDPKYAAAFERIYDDGIQVANVKDALATFERSLATPGARFDKFLLGDNDAITGEEKAGYALFKSFGCVACHQGMNVGGNMFQKLGIFEDYFEDPERITVLDYGRFNVTGRENDRHVFKVPSLRNVAITAPYFHDGSVNDLEQAVTLMARYQLGRHLSAHEIRRIVAFLRTLTGELRGTPLWR